MVIRKVRGKMQMANRPAPGRKPISAKQEAVQFKFQEASQYAKMQTGIKASQESKDLYATGITDKKHTAFVVALTDYLNSPKVHYIAAEDYAGAVGDVIAVKATDDFMVAGVKIIITDGDGNLLEKGQATPDLERVNLWTYPATAANPSLEGTLIQALAYDRPGNVASLEKTIQ